MHLTSAFCLNIFLMAAGESGEEEASRRGNEPDFDSIFGRGIEATDCNYMPTFYRF